MNGIARLLLLAASDPLAAVDEVLRPGAGRRLRWSLLVVESLLAASLLVAIEAFLGPAFARVPGLFFAFRLTAVAAAGIGLIWVVIGWYFWAWVLGLLDTLVSRRAQGFERMLTLATLASVYQTLGRAVYIGIILLRGVSSLNGQVAAPRLGLDLLLGEAPPYWFVVAGMVTPFSAASWTLLALGFSRATGYRGALPWVVIFAIAIGSILLLGALPPRTD